MISLPHDRMNQVVKRFDMLEAQMAAGPAPDVYVKLASEYSDIQELVAKIRELRGAEQELADLEAMLSFSKVFNYLSSRMLSRTGKNILFCIFCPFGLGNK